MTDPAGQAAAEELRRRYEQAAKAAMDEALTADLGDDPLPVDAAAVPPATWGLAVDRAARAAVSETLIAQADAEAVEPLYPDVDTWVEHVYAAGYARRITQSQRWCASWWDHPEAIVRLTALWRTWEAARASTDQAAMADWLRVYLDALNPPLLTADGPFSSCTPERHAERAPLALAPVPAGHWDI